MGPPVNMQFILVPLFGFSISLCKYSMGQEKTVRRRGLGIYYVSSRVWNRNINIRSRPVVENK